MDAGRRRAAAGSNEVRQQLPVLLGEAQVAAIGLELAGIGGVQTDRDVNVGLLRRVVGDRNRLAILPRGIPPGGFRLRNLGTAIQGKRDEREQEKKTDQQRQSRVPAPPVHWPALWESKPSVSVRNADDRHWSKHAMGIITAKSARSTRKSLPPLPHAVLGQVWWCLELFLWPCFPVDRLH